WRSRSRTERLFEERNADAFRTTDLLQGRRRPRLALHHLGKEGQTDADNLPFLSQAGDGLFQELLLILAHVVASFGELSECPPECRQDFPCVVRVEKIDGGEVLAFYLPNIPFPHESNCCHPV